MVNPLRQLSYALPMGFDIPCSTNSDYGEEWLFEEGDAPLNLTGYTFKIDVKTAPESTLVLHSFGMALSPSAEGLYLINAAGGVVQLIMNWETLEAIFTEVYPDLYGCGDMALYYDLLVTDNGGFRQAWLTGRIRLNKGVTNG